MKKILANLRLLSPKNLEKEVHVYGYDFSWRNHVVSVLMALSAMGLVGALFQMKPLGFGILFAALIVSGPVLVLDMYRQMFEQSRFADCIEYMEQMLFSFKKNGKALLSLKETRQMFEDGLMAKDIDKAIVHLQFGRTEGNGLLNESLALIEKDFNCSKMKMVHSIIINGEEFGGDLDNTIMLAIKDLEEFKKRGYKLHASLKEAHRNHVASIIMATGMCAVSLYVLEKLANLFNGASGIFSNNVVQFSTVIFLLLQIIIYCLSQHRLSSDWLSDGSKSQEEYILKCMEKIESGKKSLSAKLAKKDVEKEIYKALPQWMIELICLLENNNVPVALGKTRENAPMVLERQLDKLKENLEADPGSLKSYTSFCSDYDVPEITNCMKILHSYSENGTGNIKALMESLLDQVGQLQEKADQVRNESIRFRMQLMFSYPVMCATAKLMADFSVGMIFMLSILENTGGMG